MGNTPHTSRKTGTLSVIALLVSAALASGESIAETVCTPPEEWLASQLDWRFERRRELEGFPVPLTSSGRIYRRDGFTFWQTQEPIDSVLRIGEDVIEQSNEGGGFEPITAPSTLVRLINALIAADLETLEEQLEIKKQRDDDNGDWSIELTPQSDQLRIVIDAITLDGCTGVQSIFIRQVNGDTDLIQLIPPQG